MAANFPFVPVPPFRRPAACRPCLDATPGLNHHFEKHPIPAINHIGHNFS